MKRGLRASSSSAVRSSLMAVLKTESRDELVAPNLIEQARSW